MLRQASGKLAGRAALLNGDSENLPFRLGSFERVISCYGLGGVKDVEAAFQEIKRVSVPGAIVVVAEIVEPPKGKHPLRWFLHKFLAEPIFVKWLWAFRDLDLITLFDHAGIEVIDTKYITEKVFGTTMLVKGRVDLEESNT